MNFNTPFKYMKEFCKKHNINYSGTKTNVYNKIVEFQNKDIKGKVILRKQPFYRDKSVIDKTHPKVQGFTNIQVCSNSKTGKLISPMCIGPVKYVENNVEYNIPIFENFWQNLKVYTHELDENKNPTEIFFKRRNKGWLYTKGHRRVYPKKYLEKLNSKVEYVFYNNKKYDKISSKKEIYCKYYEELIKNNKYFLELKDRFNKGENLLILGFDGFMFDIETDSTQLQNNNIWNNENIIIGHEFVIMCLLLNIKPWI
jgi:hypothetical protein